MFLRLRAPQSRVLQLTLIRGIGNKVEQSRAFGELQRPSRWGGCLVIVRPGMAAVVERFGRFHRVLGPGPRFLWPWERVARYHSLMEQVVKINMQTAITADNVALDIDGTLYIKIFDAEKASYGISDFYVAVPLLAQTTMRAEIGKITFDDTSSQREHLNTKIVEQVNKALSSWGVRCLRYEILEVKAPERVADAMTLVPEAQRFKQSEILKSEGKRESRINDARAKRKEKVLLALGDAKAEIIRAEATARGLQIVSAALNLYGAKEAVAIKIADKYAASWGKLAKKGTTVLLPSDPADPSKLIASAFAVYDKVVKQNNLQSSGSNPQVNAPATKGQLPSGKNKKVIVPDLSNKDGNKIPDDDKIPDDKIPAGSDKIPEDKIPTGSDKIPEEVPQNTEKDKSKAENTVTLVR